MSLFVDPCPAASGPSSVCDLFGSARDPMMPCRMYGEPPAAGRPHQGIDLSAPEGTPVVASHGGYLTRGESGGYGLYVTVTAVAVSTRYAHLSRYGATEGWVSQGTVIGYVGQTGNATGPHLHFEVHAAGIPVDPLDYVRTTSGGSDGGTDVTDVPELPASEAASLVAAFEAKSCAEREAWLNARGITTPVQSGLFTASALGINPFTEQGLITRMEAALSSCDLIATNVIQDAAAGVGSVVDFLRLLARGETWIRVGYVVGGLAVGLLGVYWMGKALGVNLPRVGKGKGPKPIPMTVME